MDQEQIRKVKSWLASKGISNYCPSCNHTNWEVLEVIAVPTSSDASLVRMVPLACTNCGHVRLYAAARVGLGP